MKKYKVLIGDDHELILSGLTDLLSKVEEVTQVDTANSRTDLLKMATAKKYDIVFLDIHFGKHDGRDIALELKNKYPNLVLVALTSFDDKDTIQSTANAGFNAFFLKSDDVAEIAKWIKAGDFETMYLSVQTQNSYAHHTLMKDNKAKHSIHLTVREKEILRLILDEHTTKQIAEKMFLSEKTIENYRTNLMHKIDATNLAGLVKKTILLGLLN
ncbi:MAG: response regulator transcription factor [Chitinophagaceae bacterium]|jgi:DNA-binding NarL/FixJ family response regulator